MLYLMLIAKLFSMGLDRFSNVPKTYREMSAEAKTKYIADEIVSYFQLYWGIELKVAFAIICLTILVNVSLLCAIGITGNIKKYHSFLEVARGLAESLMLVSIAVQATKNMYNTTEAQEAIPGFVAFWFFSLSSVNLGLINSFTGFLRFTDKLTFSRLQWLIIMVVVAAFTLVTFVVLCVLYVNNILAFVIFICFLYYVPFMTMWIFDGLRFHHLRSKNKPTNDRAEIQELTNTVEARTSAQLQTEQQPRQLERPLSLVEILCFLMYGFCHTVAFAVVTLVIARIAWVFFRPVSMEVRLQSVPGIL
uniref:Uncharacterized protein n=1 Tax=Magallana gigas TaxID=29159 RepID=K1QYQ8_MAGGI